MSENGDIYITGKNFTLPPAVTALTNFTSVPTSWNGNTKKSQGRIFPHHNNRETCVWDCVTTTNSNTQIFYQRLFPSKQYTYI